MNYTIKPRKGDRIYLFDGFVSNGHWAIKRANIANAELFKSPEVVKATFPKLLNVNEKKETSTFDVFQKEGAPIAWTGTRWMQEIPCESGEVRLFKNDRGEYAAFDRLYLKMFDLDSRNAVLYGITTREQFGNAPTYADSDFVIMPVKAETGDLK